MGLLAFFSGFTQFYIRAGIRIFLYGRDDKRIFFKVVPVCDIFFNFSFHFSIHIIITGKKRIAGKKRIMNHTIAHIVTNYLHHQNH